MCTLAVLVQAVEELIREPPEYTATEKEWLETTKSLGEVVLSLLSSVHSLVLPIPLLKCQVSQRPTAARLDAQRRSIWSRHSMTSANGVRIQ